MWSNWFQVGPEIHRVPLKKIMFASTMWVWWKGVPSVTRAWRYLVIKWLIEGSILPLQFMDLLIKLGFDVATLHLKPFQSMHSPLHRFRQHAVVERKARCGLRRHGCVFVIPESSKWSICLANNNKMLCGCQTGCMIGDIHLILPKTWQFLVFAMLDFNQSDLYTNFCTSATTFFIRLQQHRFGHTLF